MFSRGFRKWDFKSVQYSVSGCWLPYNVSDFIGKTITVSFKANCSNENLYAGLSVRFETIDGTSGWNFIEKFNYGSSTITLSKQITETMAQKYGRIRFNFYTNASGTGIGSVGDYVDFEDIQLEINDTATEFEPFISAPSPSYPQEIECVGDITKNLFNIDKFVELVKTYDNTAIEKVVNGRRCISFRNNSLYHKDFSEVMTFKDNKQYTWSMTIKHEENLKNTEDHGVFYMGWVYENEDYINSKDNSGKRLLKDEALEFINIKFTSTFGRNVSQIGFSYGQKARWLIDLDSIQIEEGVEATEYEPFGKYKIPVTIRGKNYFDDKLLSQTEDYNTYDESAGLWTTNDVINYNRSIFYNASGATGDRDITKLVKVPKNTIICVKFYDFTNPNSESDNSKGEKQLSYAFFDNNGKIIGTQITSSLNTVTLNTPNEECWLDIRRYYSSGVISFSKIQIEDVMESTVYEPYIKSSIYNIFLDEPLRKSRDYSDYIDFKNQKVVRHIYEYIIENDEGWFTSSIQMSQVDCVRYDYQPGGFIGAKIMDVLCTHYPYIGDNPLTSEGAWANTTSSMQLRIMSKIPNIAEFKSFLIKQYENGTPVKFYYVPTTPIEEPLELPIIETNKYTNIFEIDTTLQPSNVIAQYYKKG